MKGSTKSSSSVVDRCTPSQVVEVEAKAWLSRQLTVDELYRFGAPLYEFRKESSHSFVYDAHDRYLYSITDGIKLKQKFPLCTVDSHGFTVCARRELIGSWDGRHHISAHQRRVVQRFRTSVHVDGFFLAHDELCYDGLVLGIQLELEYSRQIHLAEDALSSIDACGRMFQTIVGELNAQTATGAPEKYEYIKQKVKPRALLY
jgi:hypothetical protein